MCPAKLESDPEALKVREWRHKLQKTFLSSNKSLPKEEVRVLLYCAVLLLIPAWR